MIPTEIPDLRPDPPGWIVREVKNSNPYISLGWEALSTSDERADSATGVAMGPVWFTGSTRTDVLDLVYEYEREKLEGLRRVWVEEARELLESIYSWMTLHFADPFSNTNGPIGADELIRMSERVLSSAPPTETL